MLDTQMGTTLLNGELLPNGLRILHLRMPATRLLKSYLALLSKANEKHMEGQRISWRDKSGFYRD